MQSFNGGWSFGPKICYSCKSAAAVLYCRNDSAFLCLSCDAEIHCPSKLLGPCHPRVWVCEVCEQAPAAITCNADAATLCLACDADVHSVNPLARRHDRSAVEPFYDSAEFAVKPTSAFKFFLSNDDDVVVLPELKSEDIFFSEMDSLVEFDYPNGGGDGVVPDQSKQETVTTPANDLSTEIFCGLEYCNSRSKLDTISYPSQTLSKSVSSSSVDVGVVPDRNSASDASYPFNQTAISVTADRAIQLRGMDREARVLRYREKKKNRKFEKTIRYASRKAYAEIRPRIKGRFVKRTEMDSQVDRIFGSFPSAMASEVQYGVVPTL